MQHPQETNSVGELGDSMVSMCSLTEGGVDTLGWDDSGSLSEEVVDTLGWTNRTLSSTLTNRRSSTFSIASLSEEVAGDASCGWNVRKADKSTDFAYNSDGESTAASDDSARPSPVEEEQPSRPTGPGPLRFAPGPYERSVRAQIDDLFAHERSCFDAIKREWENDGGLAGLSTYRRTGRRRLSVNMKRVFSDGQYLHFARAANYDERSALRLMRSCNRRMLRLTCKALESQLRTKTLFILPGLQSREGYDVFYMRPSRYFPKQTKTSDIIDNLAYVMKVMLERERSSKEGIAFLANMAGWEMANFSMGYCLQFMKALQGEYFPVEVRIFLIVDPPTWFDKIWKIMKTMLTVDFQKRVRMIPSSELGAYLGDGYNQFLPDDDMEGGTNPTDDMVSDFIAYRKYVESVSEFEVDAPR